MIIKEVELNIPGTCKNEPILCNIIKKFDIVFNIIEASFSTDMGWAIVTLKGKEKEVERLFEFLQEKGIEITARCNK